MSLTRDELRAAYAKGGYEAAIALGMAHGLSRPATRGRLVRAGIHRATPRLPEWKTAESALALALWNQGVAAKVIALLLRERFGTARTAMAVIRHVATLHGATRRVRAPWTAAQRRAIDDEIDAVLRKYLTRWPSRTPEAIGKEIIGAVHRRKRRWAREGIAA